MLYRSVILLACLLYLVPSAFGQVRDTIARKVYNFGPGYHPTDTLVSLGGGKYLKHGNRKLLLSTDRGSSWEFFVNTPFESSGLFGISGHRMVFAGKKGSVQWTDDTCKTFSSYSFPSEEEYVAYLAITDSLTMWACTRGSFGQGSYRTTDGGKTWTNFVETIPFYDSRKYHPIKPYSKDLVECFIYNPPYLTTDGGQTWIDQSREENKTWWVILNDHTIINLGLEPNKAYYSTDLGKNYSREIILPAKWPVTLLFELEFLDSSRWVLGQYYTNDAGVSWKYIDGYFSFPSYMPRKAYDSLSMFGYMSDSELVRLNLPWYYSTVSGVHVKNASEFTSSAYPNPALTSTTIQYELKEGTAIRFQMVDITGKEIFNRYYPTLNQGKHEEQFDLTGLPQGVYYINVETANHERTLIPIRH